MFSTGPESLSPGGQTRLTPVLMRVPRCSLSARKSNTLSLCVAAVGRNADDVDLVHAFGLGNRYHVRSVPVGIGVGVGFD